MTSLWAGARWDRGRAIRVRTARGSWRTAIRPKTASCGLCRAFSSAVADVAAELERPAGQAQARGELATAAAFAYRGKLSGEVSVMPQQPPQVPEQTGRMAVGSWDMPERLRQDILSSWKRSLLAGLTPEQFEVPHLTEIDEDGPLAWTAAPVMARLAGELEGTGIGILLADSRGHVISQRSGERHVL